MIRKIVRRKSPVRHTIVNEPDDVVTDTMLDIVEKEGWTIFAPVPPPQVSARVLRRVYRGDTETVYVRCSQKDFRAVSRWLASLGLWDPVRTFSHQSEAD